MLKIALTGASGLVGSRIVELLHDDFEFIFLPQEKLDITDYEKVKQTIGNLDFDTFLHLAAYTNVDGAETNQDLAYKINVEGTKNVFEAVRRKNKNFIYVSTGFVFDGESPPYDENGKTNPISYYGKTKFIGEQIVDGDGMIVRLEYPYRAKYELKLDFVASIRKALSQNKPLNMVKDSFITPTFIDDIAYGLKYLFHHHTCEIFHLVGADSLSPYDAGLTIARLFGFDQKLIRPTGYDEYFAGRAKRPKKAIIRSIKNNFYKMKTFEEGLKILL